MTALQVWRLWGLFVFLLLFATACDQPSLPAPVPPPRTDSIEGPVAAKVERVIDGDTIQVQAFIWLGESITIRVRIDGIDAPEPNGRCAEERRLATLAHDYLAERVGRAPIKLTHIVYDKYGGRVRATVSDAKGDVGAALLRAGLARPYHGERRAPWCTSS
jgi:endonuclease YncB( thermonuclease family)